ncbi:hypothetical protein BC936DRAFT_142762 [Jimgerdemannia flammicorona]|uniref:Uncharacterized protein n=1 Tax=Jimgerdemannia flammicorona TaxID=994334 RepID=A0A433DES8_9FUNG|nr:hypothetical protein BC936DRAFT_142762 [Jimgerdemannia flammicorona]
MHISEHKSVCLTNTGGRLKKDTLLTYENAKGILIPALGMTLEEFEETLAMMAQEFEERETYMQFHVAYGQRPLEDWIDVWTIHPPSLIESQTSASGVASGSGSFAAR